MTLAAQGKRPPEYSRRLGRGFVVAAIAVMMLLAGGVSLMASNSPDGLDSVTRNGCTLNDEDQIIAGTCIAQRGQEHELAGGPLADYETADGGVVGVVASRLVGVVVTLGVCGGLVWLLRRTNRWGT
ncbi:MAG: PDGLE domain-containing protein [Actinomycetota bacterium]